jgi:hypothetical protein
VTTTDLAIPSKPAAPNNLKPALGTPQRDPARDRHEEQRIRGEAVNFALRIDRGFEGPATAEQIVADATKLHAFITNTTTEENDQ